jgi:hypothetical protein
MSNTLSIIDPVLLSGESGNTPPPIPRINSRVENMPYDIECEFRNSEDIKLDEVTDEIFTLLPPAPDELVLDDSLEYSSEPEPIKKINRGTGKFEYCSNNEREMLENAFQAISLTETWDFVKEKIESFQWSSDSRIWIISNKMVELGYDGHSGFSFGWTMRQMQYLAQNGVEEHKKNFIKKPPAPQQTRVEIPIGTTSRFGNMTLVYRGHIP